MFLFSLILCDSACCCAYISSVLHLYIQHVASIHPTRCIYTSIAQTHYMSIIHHRNGSLQCPQHSYVAHQFPCKHGRGGQHQITAHEAQCNGYGLSHKGRKAKKAISAPFPWRKCCIRSIFSLFTLKYFSIQSIRPRRPM